MSDIDTQNRPTVSFERVPGDNGKEKTFISACMEAWKVLLLILAGLSAFVGSLYGVLWIKWEPDVRSVAHEEAARAEKECDEKLKDAVGKIDADLEHIKVQIRQNDERYREDLKEIRDNVKMLVQHELQRSGGSS